MSVWRLWKHVWSVAQWAGVDRWNAERDRMWCHLGQWLFLHHHHHHLASQGSCPSIFLLPPGPRPPPLILSTSLLPCFFSHSKWWLCYIHQFFLYHYETVQRNQIETSLKRTLCIFAYSVCAVWLCTHTPITDKCLCLLHHITPKKKSSCPKTKGQNPIYPKV